MSATPIPAPRPQSQLRAASERNRRPFRLIRHSLALTKRSLIKTMRTPEALIDVTVQPGLFLVIFVYIFGGAVSGSTHTYLQFLLPGILAQTLAMGSVSIGVNLNTDLEKGILASGYAMGFRIQASLLSAVGGCLLVVLFGLCLSWLPVFVGMKVRTPGSVQGLMFLMLMPLTFASNVFVNPATLPGWMRSFVKVNPLTHLVGAVRGLFLGTPVGTHVWWTLAWCVGLVVVFMPLALRAYRKKV